MAAGGPKAAAGGLSAPFVGVERALPLARRHWQDLHCVYSTGLARARGTTRARWPARAPDRGRGVERAQSSPLPPQAVLSGTRSGEPKVLRGGGSALVDPRSSLSVSLLTRPDRGAAAPLRKKQS